MYTSFHGNELEVKVKDTKQKEVVSSKSGDSHNIEDTLAASERKKDKDGLSPKKRTNPLQLKV